MMGSVVGRLEILFAQDDSASPQSKMDRNGAARPILLLLEGTASGYYTLLEMNDNLYLADIFRRFEICFESSVRLHAPDGFPANFSKYGGIAAPVGRTCRHLKDTCTPICA